MADTDLDREEAVERERREARERLAEFDRTGEYISDEDVDAWLKSWGTPNELPMPTRTRVWPR